MLEKVEKTLRDGIVRYAGNYNASPLKTQLNVSLVIDGDDYTAKYKLLKNYSVMEEVTINEFRGVKIDPLRFGLMASNMICNKLITACNELGIEYRNASAMIVLGESEDGDDEYPVYIFIYDGAKSVKKISVGELLA